MTCREVSDRLVAWQDAELSPAEATRVREHLGRCGRCAARERRLAAATPRARLRVPDAVLARLEDRVDAEVVLALAERAPARPGLARRALGWLGAETRVPTAGLLVYAAALGLALAWGASNWWALSRLDGRVAGAAGTDGAPAAASGEIPAEQFAPAAYDPERSAVPAEDPVPGGAVH